MNNFHKNLNYAFSGGIIALMLATWLAPQMITKLFTPPVEYGVMCAPTGMWLMQKLIICQSLALLFGIFLVIWIKFKFSSKKPENPFSGGNDKGSCCS